jgi:hypothetical protein
VEKMAKKFRPLCVIEKLPKENIRIIGENSPNLVTLLGGRARPTLKKIRKQSPLNYQLLVVEIQGCQMVYSQTKNPTLGKFWSVLQWKMFVCIFNGQYYGSLVYFVAI